MQEESIICKISIVNPLEILMNMLVMMFEVELVLIKRLVPSIGHSNHSSYCSLLRLLELNEHELFLVLQLMLLDLIQIDPLMHLLNLN
jgi:hypothetical protein